MYVLRVVLVQLASMWATWWLVKMGTGPDDLTGSMGTGPDDPIGSISDLGGGLCFTIVSELYKLEGNTWRFHIFRLEFGMSSNSFVIFRYIALR